MKIDRNNATTPARERAAQLGSNEPNEEMSSSEQAQPDPGDDHIAASSAAHDAERITDMVEQFTSDRMKEVGEAIAHGTYNVDGEAIARKLVELHEL